MPPRREAPETSEIAEMIARSLANVIPGMVAQISGNLRQEGSSGSHQNNQNNQNPNEHMFKAFTNANTAKFTSTEGATGMLQWLESLENTFDCIGCPENLKVRFASSTFQKGVLTWWNNEVRIRGRDTALALPWADFRTLMRDTYVPKNELQKLEAEFWAHSMKGADHQGYTDRYNELAVLVPHMVTPLTRGIDLYINGLPDCMCSTVMSTNPATLQAAVHLSARITDDMVKIGVLTKDSGKSGNNKTLRSGNTYNTSNKRQRASNYAMVAPTIPVANTAVVPANAQARRGRNYTGPHPLSNACNFHHPVDGHYRQCAKCGRKNHFTNKCRDPNPINQTAAAPNANAPRDNANRGCYGCGATDHFRNRCPNLNNNNGNNNNGNGNNNNRQPARGRAFVIGAAEAR